MSATTGLLSLPPTKYLQLLTDYTQAELKKKEAAAEAKAAEDAYKALKGQIQIALAGATAAKCGPAVITVKKQKDSEKSITHNSGRVIPWSSVTSVLIGNEHVKGADIIKIFGGRDGSETITVAGI